MTGGGAAPDATWLASALDAVGISCGPGRALRYLAGAQRSTVGELPSLTDAVSDGVRAEHVAAVADDRRLGAPASQGPAGRAAVLLRLCGQGLRPDDAVRAVRAGMVLSEIEDVLSSISDGTVRAGMLGAPGLLDGFGGHLADWAERADSELADGLAFERQVRTAAIRACWDAARAGVPDGMLAPWWDAGLIDPCGTDGRGPGRLLRDWGKACPGGPSGPQGASWWAQAPERAAAGYSPAEAVRVRALPDGDPARPGPDQLDVMQAMSGR